MKTLIILIKPYTQLIQAPTLSIVTRLCLSVQDKWTGVIVPGMRNPYQPYLSDGGSNINNSKYIAK